MSRWLKVNKGKMLHNMLETMDKVSVPRAQQISIERSRPTSTSRRSSQTRVCPICTLYLLRGPPWRSDNGHQVIDEFDGAFNLEQAVSQAQKLKLGLRFHNVLVNLKCIYDVDHTEAVFGFRSIGGTAGEPG